MECECQTEKLAGLFCLRFLKIISKKGVMKTSEDVACVFHNSYQLKKFGLGVPFLGGGRLSVKI